MENINDQSNRELCEAHGIYIYPKDIAWHTYIEVDNNGKTKTGKQRWLQYTLFIRGKWVKGYEDRIAEMYAHYAAKIKKRLKAKQFEAAALLPLLQPYKPLDDWFYVAVLFVSICAIVMLIVLIAILICKFIKIKKE